MSYSNNKEEILDTLAAMRHQEETAYASVDFLKNHQTQVDRSCRTKMAAWCHQVVSFCKFQRESVEIALSLIDRFVVADPIALQDRSVYQLACMTSLYTAIKIHEHTAIHSNVITQLSQGTYSIAQVEAMEQRILTAVGWRVHPPTSTSFARLLVDLLDDSSLNEKERNQALRLTMLQCESAVADYRFIAVSASTIACAALMNSLESLSSCCAVQPQQTSPTTTTRQLQDALGQEMCPKKLWLVRTSLFHAIVGEESTKATVPILQHEQHACLPLRPKQLGIRATSESSPRSVAAAAAEQR